MTASTRALVKTRDPKTGNSSSHANKTNSSPSINSPIDQISLLQRTIGNREVQRLLKSGVNQVKPSDGQPAAQQVFRPKVNVGERDDKFPQESARVAERRPSGAGSILRSAVARGGLQHLYGNQLVLQARNGSGGQRAPSASLRPSESGILQRKCACGSAAGMSGECEGCVKKRRLGLQTKLKVNKPGDVYEHEADRIADQAMAAPARHAVSGTPPRIQRFSGQSNGPMAAAPASVDQALANPGKPLDPALQQDMEERFGYDFSKVRVHSGAAAEQSARDVTADAYTVGRDIVFGAGRFAPGTHPGRRLIAHELTHVVQQSGSDGIRVASRNPKRALSPISLGTTSQNTSGPSAHSSMSAPLVSRGGFARVAIRPTAGNMASERVFRKETPVEGAVQPATVAEFIANPPSAIVTVTLSGMTVRMDERAKLAPGPGPPQLMAVTLRALLGTQYQPDLVAKYLKKRGGSKATGLFAEGASVPAGGAQAKGKPTAEGKQATAGEGAQTIKRENKFLLDAGSSFLIAASLKASGFQLTLTTDQEEILISGFVAAAAWTEMVALMLGPGKILPDWYNEWIFDRQMAGRLEALKAYSGGLARLVGKQRSGGKAEMSHWRKAVLEDIASELLEEAEFVEAIRTDTSLLMPTAGLEEGRRKKEEEQAAKMYRELWAVPENAGLDVSPPRKAKDEWLVSALLSFGHSQPAYRQRSLDEGDREARVEMLVRLGRFTQRVASSAPSDEALRSSPATANAPPFPSVIAGAPALPGPLFQAPLEAERRFLMKLEFRSVYEAFAFYSFRWQLVPVKYTPPLPELEKTGTLPEGSAPLKPGETAKSEALKATKPEPAPNVTTPATASAVEPSIEKPPSEYDENAAAASIAVAMADTKALRKAKGEDFSNLDLLRHRYARAAKYHEEDMRTISRELGPAGAGASDLATVNAMIRYAGAGLGTLIDVLFEKNLGTSSEKIITFPKPGIYVVRCIGVAVLSSDKDEELVRAPSVAYHPVFVRPSEEIAASSVYTARRRSDDESALQTELEKVLKDPELTDPEREMLTALQKDITANKQGVKATLELQLSRLKESIKEKEKNKRDNAGVLSQLYDERERLEELLKMQRKRGLGAAKPLRATFVGDSGQTLPLQMEAATREPDPGKWRATVSDLTTIRGGKDSGAGPTRDDAVLDGVQNVLESGHGYGRGYVAVEITGKIKTLRVAADVGQITMEGIENLTTLLSIAAIAAAPFTAGASLMLLIPIGAVGAIPSVYRLVERSRVGTLRWDLETAMDLVNIVGAAAGVGQAGVAGRVASATTKGVRPGVWTIRAGKGLMVIGIASDAGGAVLLGAGIIEQLNALAGLPEGERKARTLQILGGALLNAGITVGGSLAARGVELQNQQRLAALRDIQTRTPAREMPTNVPLEKTPKVDVGTTGKTKPADTPTTAKTRNEGPDPRMAKATRVTDAPKKSPLKPRGETAPKVEPESKGKTTAGTRDSGAGTTTRPADTSAAAREEADPLRQALARGEDSPELTLPALHTDRTSLTIPPDFTWTHGVTEWPHAMQRYWEARRAAPGREVGVWRNATDGSYAITVGTGTAVDPPTEAGPWVGVLHYHPNPDNTTRFQMPAPTDFAELMRRFQEGDGKVTVREFVDYGGPGQRQGRTEFGITAGDPMPFYVTTTTPSGEKVTLRFKDDGHFRQEWGGQEVYVGKEIADAMKRDLDIWLASMRQSRAQLNPPPPPAGARTTAGTKGGKTTAGTETGKTTASKRTQAEEPPASGSVPKTPATPPPLTVISRYGSRAKFVEAVTQKLGTGSDPRPPGWERVIEALKANPGPNNTKILTKIEKVMDALQDPKLYGEVLGDAWDLVKAGKAVDINDALLTMARKTGLPVSTVTKVKRGVEFFKQVATKRAYWIDKALGDEAHGQMTHLLQDLVVNKALGGPRTSAEFRQLLGRAEGTVNRYVWKGDKLVPSRFAEVPNTVFVDTKNKAGGVETEFDVKTGDYVWRFMYDLFYTGEALQRLGRLPQPERLRPLLNELADIGMK